MLRLAKMTDYAVVVLTHLADCMPVQTSPGIAAEIGVPEPTVAKVLKCLAGRGLVVSQRGARGGYRLARPLDTIAIADVVTAIEGPIALTACVDSSTAACDSRCQCPMHRRWDRVNDAVREALSAISLADMRADGSRALPARSALPVFTAVAE